MKCHILSSLAALLIAGCAMAPQKPTPSVEGEIHAITRRSIEAVKSGDRDFFEYLLAEDYLGTAVDGRVIDKSAFLASFQPPPPEMNAQFEVEDVRMRVRGDTAVLNARRNFHGEINGQPLSQSERTTQIFIHEGGRWQLLAEQSSPL